MRYMGLLKQNANGESRIPAGRELLERMSRFMDEIVPAGVSAAGQCEGSASRGACVRLAGGKLTVTEGPLPEASEPARSYAMFDVQSIAEAVEWTMSFLQVLGEGECEIRPVRGESDLAIA